MADRSKLLKQFAMLEAIVAPGSGASPNEVAVSRRLLTKIRKELEQAGAPVTQEELRSTQRLTFDDVDRFSKKRTSFDEWWVKENSYRLGRQDKTAGNHAYDDDQRWLRWIRMGVMPNEDAWISDKNGVVDVGLTIDRFLEESLRVLEEYLGSLQGLSRLALESGYTGQVFAVESGELSGVASSAPFYPEVYESSGGKDLTLEMVRDAVELTEAKIRMLKNEYWRRRRKELPYPAPALVSNIS